MFDMHILLLGHLIAAPTNKHENKGKRLFILTFKIHHEVKCPRLIEVVFLIT